MESSNEGPSKKGRGKKKDKPDKRKTYDGRPLAILRTIRELTQQEVADLAGLDVRRVGRFERGQSPPDEKELLKLIDALGVPIFVVEDLRETITFVERLTGQSSHWSGRIGGEESQAEAVHEPVPQEAEAARSLDQRVNDARIVIRAQKTLGETLWRLLQGPDGPER